MKTKYQFTGSQIVLWCLLAFIAIVFVGALSSCSTNKHTPPSEPIPTEPVEPTDPIEQGKGVVVTSYLNFPKAFEKQYREAVAKAEEVKRTVCFRDFMTSRELIETNGLSRDQVVYELINKSVTTRLQYYSRWSWSKVPGYTYDNTDMIWVNGYYQRSWGICDRAANFGHESSHKQGFTHSYEWTPTREFSVPYSAGIAIQHCCKN